MSFNFNAKSRSAIAKNLADRPFSIFATWKFPKKEMLQDQYGFEASIATDFEKYLSFVGCRVFGKRAVSDRTKALRHITVFERESRFGGRTVLHAHSLIEASPENLERIIFYLKLMWKKFRRFQSFPEVHFKKVEGIQGATRYITKFVHHDTFLLLNLP